MPWLTTAPILVWAVIAITLLVLLWFINPPSRLNQIIAWLAYTALNLYFFLAVNWTAVNYYLRILPLVLSFALLLRWLKPLRNSPWLPEKSVLSLGLTVLLLVLLGSVGYMDYRVNQSTSLKNIQQVPVLAMFPVRTGMYTVINGGNGLYGWAMNGYTTNWLGQPIPGNEDLAFAVDIIEIRTSGAAAKKVLSKDFRDYEIYNELVFSPCVGEVVFVEDGHSEVEPLSPGTGSGNQIVIRCADFLITLSNLRNNSIKVGVGDQVDLRRQVANVGSSADRTVPHLHMYATTLDGQPVPILFEAGYNFKFVARNYIYVR